MEITNYKIILAGDGGVGKTTYINRLLKGEFTKTYIPTLGVDVFVLAFTTNYGKFVLDIWDTAGQEKFMGLGDNYFMRSDGAIVMFDITAKNTLKNIKTWVSSIKNKNTVKDIPIGIYGNKFDVVIKDEDRIKTKYTKISCKSCYNVYAPIVDILQKITGHKDLVQVVDVEEELAMN